MAKIIGLILVALSCAVCAGTKPADVLTTRVVKQAKGSRTIEVRVAAVPRELVVKYRARASDKVTERTVAPGAGARFTFYTPSEDKWLVAVYADGKLIDTERSGRKSGLGGAKLR